MLDHYLRNCTMTSPTGLALDATRQSSKLVFVLVATAALGNLPARAQFGPQQELTSSSLAASSVYATDLDGDGDADVLPDLLERELRGGLDARGSS